MYEVTTPGNMNYCGVTEGVGFANGKALVVDKATAEMLAHDYGYSIKAIKEKAGKEKPEKTVEETPKGEAPTE
jgi:hypothetical protein